MNHTQENNPLVLNLDKSPGKLGPNECFFLRNHDRTLSLNGNKRGTLGKTSPLRANFPACIMNQPAGECYSVGEYYCAKTNETYSWIWNQHEVHYVLMIDGDGNCHRVYDGCLKLSAEPQHTIDQFKAYLAIDKMCANTPGGIRKRLLFTDGLHDIGCIDVGASLATDSFNTPFFQRCTDPCELIRLCVPDPCGCLHGEFVEPTAEDALKKNGLLDTGIKLSYRHVYYDGRKSIYADPTSPFYQDTRGCFENGNFSRCIKLRVPIGNALVEKIEIIYWQNGVWYLYDTIEKYKKYNDSQQYWFDRELSEEVEDTFSEDDCSFDYLFCLDKQCEPIDMNDFNRVYNPIPREVQCLFEIGIGEDRAALAFVNYIKGSCKIDEAEIKKLGVTIDCTENDCQSEFVEIIIRAVVHNFEFHRNQPIFRLGGDTDNAVDDPTDTAYFGGLNDVANGDLELTFGQQFREKTRNFIVYVEGTEYWAEMKQWKAHAFFTQLEQWGTLPNFDDNFTKRRWRRAIKAGEFFYQEAKLKVPRGTRGFLRLTSHESINNDQDKSTFLGGTLTGITTYKGNLDITATINNENEEIYFNACNAGPLTISDFFVIRDNAIDDAIARKASAYHGYVKDVNGLPVEGAVIKIVEGSTIHATCTTDHNGFYHTYVFTGINDPVNVEVHVEQDCGDPLAGFAILAAPQVESEKGVNVRHDITITDEAYGENFFATVKAKAVDCIGAPIAGVRIAISGSKYKVTQNDGYATFKIRNYLSRNRQLRTIALNTGGCFTYDCANNCNPCMPQSVSDTPACFQSLPIITMADVVLNRESVSANRRGLKAGGSYPFAAVAKGRCGRQSPAYQIAKLDIPKTQEKNKESFCKFGFTDSGAKWPDWVDCVDILRGENLNPFELQWVVDKIDRTNDGKIILTIQSLIDYNERFLFKTNTTYQWLANDRIEFIKNGDGKIFPIGQNGLLNFLTLSPFHDELISEKETAEADFFNQLIIPDDGRLDDLEEGALIEIQRAKQCTSVPVFYSICVSIPVINGSMQYPAGIFETFDTYFVNRKIGNFPLQRFEHHSPSDFWGTKLTDAGRGYFENKYENERRYGRNITVSPPLEINRFGDIERTLNPDSHGDIIAVIIKDNKIGIAISESDNSLFQVGDDLVRVAQDGTMRAASGEQVISDTQAKVAGAFGCPYELASSVFVGDGFVLWYDGYNLIKHNFQQAVAIDIDKVNSWFTRKGQELFKNHKDETDPLNKIRVCCGENWANASVHYTFKSLRDPAYNNELNPYSKQNETIIFDPVTDDFLTFSSFTGERYSVLEILNGTGCAFLAYFKGVPYIFPIIADTFNEFFGIPCDWMVGIVLNRDDKKMKEPLAIEQQSGNTFFFVKEVTTENINFKSEIPPAKWEKDGDKWNASFLNNINSRGGLYGDDDRAFGFYTKVLFVRDNTDGLKYNTVDNNKRTAYSELDNILFKFKAIEQSGFTENV